MAKKNRLVWTDDVMSFLCKRCNEMYPDEPCEHSDCLMIEELDKCKTVDAVEVVRCKDCRFYRKPFCILNDNKNGWLNHELPEHFCSHGERETDG